MPEPQPVWSTQRQFEEQQQELAELRRLADLRSAVLEREVSELKRKDHDLRRLIESRAEVAAQQAMAYAALLQEATAKTTERLAQHLPGFINAMASVPALANLIREQKAELQSIGTRVGALDSDVDSSAASLEALSARVDDLDGTNFSTLAQQVSADLQKLEQAVAALKSSGDRVGAEQAQLWEALGRQGEETGHLWKSAELATREVGNLWKRLEFVRTEILYEMRYASFGRQAIEGAAEPHQPLITSELRERNAAVIAAAAPEDLKINLGSGHRPLPGYINVDMREVPGVDVVAELSDLPFAAGTVAEIMSEHVLEHFPQEQLKRLLPYWRGLLKPGGRFMAVVPDGEAMIAAVSKGEVSFADYREVLFGGQEYEGDFHYNLFTPASLRDLLETEGYSQVEVVEAGRPNGICFEFEIRATA